MQLCEIRFKNMALIHLNLFTLKREDKNVVVTYRVTHAESREPRRSVTKLISASRIHMDFFHIDFTFASLQYFVLCC